MKPPERPRTIARVAMAVCLAGAFGGCAGVAEVTGTATQQDLMQLRADVTQVQLALQRAKAETDRYTSGVDARLAEESTKSRAQAEDIARRMETLSATVTALSGRVEELATRLEAVGRRPATGSPAPAAPTGRPAPAPAPHAARPSGGTIQPQDVYQAAYTDFSKSNYPLAIAGFREFLRRYPEHELANSAQYWIGEAHWSVARGYMNAGQPEKATPELERAVQEFRKVVANYPRGEKVPTALYKEALALVELKQPALARSRLQYLIDNFPQAAETPLARERLAALTGG